MPESIPEVATPSRPAAATGPTGGPVAAARGDGGGRGLPRPDGPTRRARIALVLGGGALKGLAHVGALRALEEAGLRPALYAGSSIGALIAAAAAGGTPVAELERRARALRRRDLFRINHVAMVMERMLARAIYLEDPLRALCDALVPEGTFDDLPHPLLVTTVDVEHGLPIVWGRPGLRAVRVRDAVYASCALPGFFPPGAVGARTCIDGGATDNLPVRYAAFGVDALVAVDVGIAEVPAGETVATQGFASVFMRAATLMMRERQQAALEGWDGPPLLLVRPKVSHIGWFSFAHADELLQAGYDAMRDALPHLDRVVVAPGGIHPRRRVRVLVDRDRCTGCGQCVVRAPAAMVLDPERKAAPRAEAFDWSPADGAFVHYCPEEALAAETLPAPRVARPRPAADIPG